MPQFKGPHNASQVAQAFNEMRVIAQALARDTASVSLLSEIRKAIGQEALKASLEDTMHEAAVSHEAKTSRVLVAIPRTVTMPTEKVEKHA